MAAAVSEPTVLRATRLRISLTSPLVRVRQKSSQILIRVFPMVKSSTRLRSRGLGDVYKRQVLYDVPALLRLQHFLHLLFSELLSINELQGLSLVRYLVEYLEVLLHARLFARVDDAVGRDVDDSVLDLRQRLHCRNEL